MKIAFEEGLFIKLSISVVEFLKPYFFPNKVPLNPFSEPIPMKLTSFLLILGVCIVFEV